MLHGKWNEWKINRMKILWIVLSLSLRSLFCMVLSVVSCCHSSYPHGSHTRNQNARIQPIKRMLRMLVMIFFFWLLLNVMFDLNFIPFLVFVFVFFFSILEFLPFVPLCMHQHRPLFTVYCLPFSKNGKHIIHKHTSAVKTNARFSN